MLPAPMAPAQSAAHIRRQKECPPLTLFRYTKRARSAQPAIARPLLQEYISYSQSLAQGQAGKLEPGEGETTQACRPPEKMGLR